MTERIASIVEALGDPYYTDGRRFVYCGDSRELLPLIPAGSIDLVLTDPPYGIAYDASKSTQQGIQRFEMIAGDDERFDLTPLLAFNDVICWGANFFCDTVPPREGAWYAWDKVLQNSLKVRIGEIELAWHKRGTNRRAYRHLWSGAYRGSERGEKSQHPNQKPVALLKWCIGLAPKADLILDPYLGSGTTLVAAKQLDMQAIGIELNERYAEVAAKRLRQGVLEFA